MGQTQARERERLNGDRRLPTSNKIKGFFFKQCVFYRIFRQITDFSGITCSIFPASEDFRWFCQVLRASFGRTYLKMSLILDKTTWILSRLTKFSNIDLWAVIPIWYYCFLSEDIDDGAYLCPYGFRSLLRVQILNWVGSIALSLPLSCSMFTVFSCEVGACYWHKQMFRARQGWIGVSNYDCTSSQVSAALRDRSTEQMAEMLFRLSAKSNLNYQF